MNTKYQRLIETEDVNNNDDDNNNNSVSCYNLNLNVTPSPPPKQRPPINLHAQLVGDDLFRTLVTRDTIDHLFNRSKSNFPYTSGKKPDIRNLNFLLHILSQCQKKNRKRCSTDWLLRIGTNYFICS